MLTRKLLIGGIAAAIVASPCLMPVAQAATLSVVSPADKAVVPLLSAEQKAYLAMGRAERRVQYADYAARKKIAKFGDRPQKVTLDWRLAGTNGTERVRYVVRVTSEPGGATFWQGETEKTHVRLDNFEIGRTYAWKVTAKTAGGEVSAIRKSQYFDTLDLAMTVAAQGNGVAIGDWSLIGDDLKAGRLAMPFDFKVRTGGAYLLGDKTRRRHSRRRIHLKQVDLYSISVSGLCSISEAVFQL